MQWGSLLRGCIRGSCKVGIPLPPFPALELSVSIQAGICTSTSIQALGKGWEVVKYDALANSYGFILGEVCLQPRKFPDWLRHMLNLDLLCAGGVAALCNHLPTQQRTHVQWIGELMYSNQLCVGQCTETFWCSDSRCI